MKDGETLLSYCKRNGLSYWTMHTRCDKFGLTPEEALVRPPREYKNLFYVNGEPLKKSCRKHKINYSSVLTRMYRLKCSVEEAFKHFKEREKINDGRVNRRRNKDGSKYASKGKRERCRTLRVPL